MATVAVIVHHIPGRARLLVREKRGDTTYFSDLSESFGRFENVQSARANPTTGSLTLEFLGELGDVLRRAEEENVLTVAQGLMTKDHRSSPVRSARSTASPINLVSGREVNRMFMVGSALIVIGVIQTVRGEWFPPAFSVFWYAAEAFRMAEKSD